MKLDRHDLEGRSEVARADEPGLTKYLNATELGVGSARDPLSPNLAGASFSDEGDPLGRLSVAARNDAQSDAHSSPVSDARWLRL
jgi:hypothetical protein